MPKVTKALRLLQLLKRLSENSSYLTAKELAIEFGVTERTIYRYIDQLSEIGFPIYQDCGYRMHRIKLPNDFRINSEDLEFLKIIFNSSSLSRSNEFKDKFYEILERFQSLINFDDKIIESHCSIKNIDSLSNHVTRINLSEMENAIRNQIVCLIDYQSLDEPISSQRVLHPYAMTIRNGRWYLIANDSYDDNIKIYRLDRVKNILPTREKFVRNTKFDIEEYFHNSWSVFRGECITIKLKLTGFAARFAQEMTWLKQKHFEWLDEKNALLTLTVQGENEVKRWILSMGDEVEVLEPVEFRKNIKEILQKVADVYQ